MNKVRCDEPEPSDRSKIINKDMLVSYDIFLDAYQHHMINGLASTGMLADWVFENSSERGFFCVPVICDIIKQAYGNFNVTQITVAKNFPIWIRNLHAAFVDWHAYNLTWDSYPIGSYHLVRINSLQTYHIIYQDKPLTI